MTSLAKVKKKCLLCVTKIINLTKILPKAKQTQFCYVIGSQITQTIDTLSMLHNVPRYVSKHFLVL